MNVFVTWDADGVFDAEFFPVKYGSVFRFHGRQLPQRADQWSEYRYLPPLELELLIVRMAARGVRFREIRRRVRRPRWELAAILNWHGYVGLPYAQHGDGEGWES